MTDPIEQARARALPRLKRMMMRGWPRVEVSAMLAFTSLSGFLCSYGLLHLGVDGMGLRYGVSTVVAYAVFLAQLRFWVARAAQRRLSAAERGGASPLDAVDALDGVDGGSVGLPRVDLPARWASGGGRFAGAGASGDFQLPPGLAADAGGGTASSSSGGGLDVSLDLDLDDGWPIVAAIVVLALVGSSVVAAGYIVYTAPTLLAEVFFDGVIAGVLYKRLRRGSLREWWQGALGRTWIPALVVFLVFVIGGLVLERAAPGCRTLGEVVRWLLT